VKHAVPEDVFPGWTPVGLNERLRFLRYDVGQKFEVHYDGSYSREDGSGERSRLTLLLYLNDAYEGALTTFYSERGPDVEEVPVPITTGTVLLHDHALAHGVPPLVRGRKYVVRTDVMFRRC
jgi:predicted 2-oxoglutarate/Fe(II)-dependent dioxygenase YbiX